MSKEESFVDAFEVVRVCKCYDVRYERKWKEGSVSRPLLMPQVPLLPFREGTQGHHYGDMNVGKSHI